MNKPSDKREIFIEYVVQGSVMKATAIDTATGTEASIVGPANAPRKTQTQTAANKLKYVLGKKA